MFFPFYIARRYFASKNRQGVVNIINRITFFVITIGAASLLIVLSAFSGLKDFSISFSNTFDPDMRILPSQGKYFDLNQEQIQKIRGLKGVVSVSGEVEERVFLSYKQKNHTAFLKGVDSAYAQVTALDSALIFGNWFDYNKREVITGISISNLLSLGLNDYLDPLVLIVPKPGKGSLQATSKAYNQIAVNVSGVYSLTEALDKKYVFGSLSLAQELLGKDVNTYSALNLSLTSGADEPYLRKEIQLSLPMPVVIKNRAQLNEVLYKMLNTENLAIYLIFTLVLIIALFNLVGAIIVLILEKKENLRTLHFLGTPIKQLRSIFFLQGMIASSLAGVFGVLCGAFLVWTQITFEWIKINPSLPYPVALTWYNAIIVFFTIIVLGFVASKIASTRVTAKFL